MSLLGKVRQHSVVLVVVVIVCCIAFIIQEFAYAFMRRGHGNDGKCIAVVNGDKIMFDDFQRRLDITMANAHNRYKIQTNDSFFRKYFGNSVLTSMINEKAYVKMAKNMQIKVGVNETIDMVQGDHIDDEIRSTFVEDKNGTFDKGQLVEYLKKASKSDNMSEWWNDYELKLKDSRCKKKMNMLAKNLSFVNKLERQREWKEKESSIDLNVIYIPYDSVDGSKYKIVDRDLKDYVDKNKHDYLTDEEYEIKYFIVPFKLSDLDVSLNSKELETIRKSFVKSKSPMEFAKYKSDNVKEEDTSLYKDYVFTVDRSLLPDVLKDKTLSVGDSYYEVSKTMDDFNRVYRVLDIQKKDGEEQFEVAVLKKEVRIGDKTKKETFSNVKKEFKKITNVELLNKYVDEKKIDVKSKTLKIDSGYIDDKINNARSIVREIFTTHKKNNDALFFTEESGILVCYILEHTLKGVKKMDKIKDEVREKVIKHRKFKAIEKEIMTLVDDNISVDLMFNKVKDIYKDKVKLVKENNLSFKDERIDGCGHVVNFFNTMFFPFSDNICIEDENGLFVVLKNSVNIKCNDSSSKDYNEKYTNLCDKMLKGRREEVDTMMDNLILKRFNVVDYRNLYT